MSNFECLRKNNIKNASDNGKPQIDTQLIYMTQMQTDDYRKNRPSMPPARLLTMFPESARLAKVDAWLNRSHRENATVLVMVKINAMTGTADRGQLLSPRKTPGRLTRREDLPIKLSQMTLLRLTMARTASPTHNAGVTYKLSQKNLLSVALMVRVLGSDDSNTQCESPEAVLTSFHQRRPTNRRPAIFFK